MAAAHVQRTADIKVGIDHSAYPRRVQQLDPVVAVAPPQRLLLLQRLELTVVHGGKHPAVLEVAIDGVAAHPVADYLPAFEGHFPQQARLPRPHLLLHHVQIAAVAVDYLPAVAPGRPESHPGRFQHCYPEALLQQEQRGRDAGVARSDHADVGFMGTLQGRALRSRAGRGGVIGMWIGCVTHATHLVRYFLHCMHATAGRTAAPEASAGQACRECRAQAPSPEPDQRAALGRPRVMMMHSMEKPSMMAIAWKASL